MASTQKSHPFLFLAKNIFSIKKHLCPVKISNNGLKPPSKIPGLSLGFAPKHRDFSPHTSAVDYQYLRCYLRLFPEQLYHLPDNSDKKK